MTEQQRGRRRALKAMVLRSFTQHRNRWKWGSYFIGLFGVFLGLAGVHMIVTGRLILATVALVLYPVLALGGLMSALTIEAIGEFEEATANG